MWRQGAAGMEQRPAAGSGRVRPCEDGRSGVSPGMAGKAKRRSGVAGMRGLSEQDIDAERL